MLSRLSPHGESGLKYVHTIKRLLNILSLPTRGEWIEIVRHQCKDSVNRCLSPHGESGLKYKYMARMCLTVLSLPTRGEWIEIE